MRHRVVLFVGSCALCACAPDAAQWIEAQPMLSLDSDDAAMQRDAGADAAVDATTDAISAPEPCPFHVDRMTLRVPGQRRLIGLGDDAIGAARSEDPAVVDAILHESGVEVRALTAGSTALVLSTAQSTARVPIDVDLAEDLFVTEVVEVRYGEGAGFGQANMPDAVLGPPRGRGVAAGSLDVVSLGLGGSITLQLGVDIVDGPGADLIVFENAFVGFVERGQVSVSQDGVNFEVFACEAVAPYTGCSGVRPVHAHPDSDIDVTDVASAGGDAFDLGAIGVARARYLRIDDVGGIDTGGGMAGFDLDAVIALHSLPRGEVQLRAPARMELAVEQTLAPRMDVTTPERTLYGVAARCRAEPTGIVEIGCGCALRGVSQGEAQLHGVLGELEVVVTVQVNP